MTKKLSGALAIAFGICILTGELGLTPGDAVAAGENAEALSAGQCRTLSPPRNRPLEAPDSTIDDILRIALDQARRRFGAKAAWALLAKVDGGEMVATVRSPDKPSPLLSFVPTSRLSQFRVLKTPMLALMLDAGSIELRTVINVRKTRLDRGLSLHDEHPLDRYASVEEIFLFSSDLGVARLQRSRMTDALADKLAQMQALVRQTQPQSVGPESSMYWFQNQLIPIGNRESITPLQTIAFMNAVANGGRPLSVVFSKPIGPGNEARSIIKEGTAERLRYLLRQNVEMGSAKKANAPGYDVAGESVTLLKWPPRTRAAPVLTLFTGFFPVNCPQYLIFIGFDEPRRRAGAPPFTSATWNAVPLAGDLIAQLAPLLGIEKRASGR